MHHLRAPARTRAATIVLVLAVGGALAGCSPQASTTPATPGPLGSGSARCAAAPQPPRLPAWQPPATPPSLFPLIIANPGELTCGRNRVLFTFFDASNNSIAAPDRTVKIAVFDLARDPEKAVASADGTFIWAIENVRGIYVASLPFQEAGTYGAEFTTSVGGGPAQTIRVTFDVSASTSLVQPGQAAPASKTPTAADAGGDLTHISTDATPDPALYETSVDQALAKHQPFVVVFATPKFCTSAQCGPTLDRIKPFVTRFPGVAFIHVEPYELKLENGALAAVTDSNGLPIPTAVTNQWGLASEPWVFVVDRTGVVRGSFGLIFSDAELATALETVK
jgi:hypothetical protein